MYYKNKRSVTEVSDSTPLSYSTQAKSIFSDSSDEAVKSGSKKKCQSNEDKTETVKVE